MDDKIFKVDLERSRVYWDYYKSMFTVFSSALVAGMICAALIYTKGEINLTMAAAVIVLLFLCIILLAALMSLVIWRHENRHFDELVREEEREAQERPPGVPLV
jgi:archaellum biogenesis protein FlaJ (TadC family)